MIKFLLRLLVLVAAIFFVIVVSIIIILSPFWYVFTGGNLIIQAGAPMFELLDRIIEKEKNFKN